MNPRILVALLSATMLAGCGFSDSSNYAGGAFLDAQGESVSPRAEASLDAATRSVEYLPPEGCPALPGFGLLVIGSVGKDSIRTVVGFDLRVASTWGGADSLRKRPFKALAFRVTDSSWKSKLRVRMVLTDTVAKPLPALFMGVEPSKLPDLQSLMDTVVTVAADSIGDYSIAISPAVSERIVSSTVANRGWLTVLLDPVVGSGTSSPTLVRFHIRPYLLRDSTPEMVVKEAGTLEDMPASRSIQMRPSDASSEVIGWWAGSGRRARLALNGEAIRASLHRQVPANDITEETDNSYHVLQARASLGMQSVAASSYVPNPRMLVTSRVIEREDSAQLVLGTALQLPSSVLTTEDAGTDGAVDLKCTELVAATLVNCSVRFGGVDQYIYTRMAEANMNFLDYKQNHFWLRTDVADQAEFAVLNNLRVSIRTENTGHGAAHIWVKWIRIHSWQSPDSQSDSAGVRAKSKLATGTDRIELELRSALSQVILQKKRKVVLDLMPVGGNSSGLDLWTAQPTSPNRLIDSVHVLLRPSDGRNF
ncbi:MAG: hypothetical protein IPK50_18370 [Fibrobacterota bacterium]|nr:MAG: hypothetical protein IPK50_18370 [Fibrobacterota bacterium]